MMLLSSVDIAKEVVVREKTWWVLIKATNKKDNAKFFVIKILKYLNTFLFFCFLYAYIKSGIQTKNRAMLLLKHSP